MNDPVACSEPAPAQATRLAGNTPPIALWLILIAGLLGILGCQAPQPASTPAETDFISATELAERHGLGVRLIGVTAGGGMVDFRLKILDPGKAQQFLQDPGNLPRLVVAESGVALPGTEAVGDDTKWEEGGILFSLVSNTGGAVQLGTPVIVQFGDLQLEPIPAQ